MHSCIKTKYNFRAVWDLNALDSMQICTSLRISYDYEDGGLQNLWNNRSIRLAYKPYFFSKRTVFFSHTKSANSTFSHGLLAKQAQTNRTLAWYLLGKQGCAWYLLGKPNHSVRPYDTCTSVTSFHTCMFANTCM